MALNKVFLEGRITFEPELKTTTSGTEVVRLSVACERDYKNAEGNRDADFVDVAAFKNNATFVQKYFHKGDAILIEGSIQTNTYTDKDGNKRKSSTVIADRIKFPISKKNSGNAEGGNTVEQPAPEYASADNSDFEEIIDDDDLPF